MKITAIKNVRIIPGPSDDLVRVLIEFDPEENMDVTASTVSIIAELDV